MTTFSKKRQLALRLARVGTSLAAVAIAGSLAIPTAALAQAGSSTLRGHAPAGSQVVAREIATGATRTATAGADGTYVIAGLTGGNYHVTPAARLKT